MLKQVSENYNQPLPNLSLFLISELHLISHFCFVKH